MSPIYASGDLRCRAPTRGLLPPVSVSKIFQSLLSKMDTAVSGEVPSKQGLTRGKKAFEVGAARSKKSDEKKVEESLSGAVKRKKSTIWTSRGNVRTTGDTITILRRPKTQEEAIKNMALFIGKPMEDATEQTIAGLLDASVEKYIDEVFKSIGSELIISQVGPSHLHQTVLGVRGSLRESRSSPDSSLRGIRPPVAAEGVISRIGNFRPGRGRHFGRHSWPSSQIPKPSDQGCDAAPSWSRTSPHPSAVPIPSFVHRLKHPSALPSALPIPSFIHRRRHPSPLPSALPIPSFVHRQKHSSALPSALPSPRSFIV